LEKQFERGTTEVSKSRKVTDFAQNWQKEARQQASLFKQVSWILIFLHSGKHARVSEIKK
jgi:hypothetical protein